MECGSCGKAAAEDAEFCSGCGARLKRSGEEARVPLTESAGPDDGSLRCPRCKRSNERGSAFCYFCGMPLDGGAVLSGRLATVVQELPAGSVGPAGLRRAGFWVRFCAAAIDAILLMIIDWFMLGTDVTDVYTSQELLLSSLISLLYYSLGVAIWSTTVGKRLLGLYVLRSDGSKVGFLRAVGRWFSYILSALILFIGFFMVGLRRDKRGLHDLICDTVVVSSPGGRP